MKYSYDEVKALTFDKFNERLQ